MFQQTNKPQTGLGAAYAMSAVIYHATVRSVRQTHNNAIIGLLINMLQTMILVGVFYLMFSVLGMRGAAIRGDFLLYIMSGIFLFMTHIKTLGAVSGSGGPTSAMMQHAPMNTFVAIISAAASSLYTQFLSVSIVMGLYHIAITPVVIHNVKGVFAMFISAWFTGVAVGMVFLAIKPWLPQFTGIAQQLYSRANMLASGKMFVANTLPFYMIAMFSWNPLFHIIDQARGYAFINYNPHYSSPTYPVYVGCVLMLIGLLGENYTRKHASLSWGARN